MRRTLAKLPVAGALLACAAQNDHPEEEVDAGIEEGITAVDAAGDSSGIDSLSGGSAKLDVVGGDAEASASAAESSEDGCKKVDFLFVIDDSNSMGTNQAELIRSFPEFVTTIQSSLASVQSYHVGVVTSDQYEFNEPGCTMYGALVTQTGGKESSARQCDPYAGGARFMTDADDLMATFACAAQVGTGGDNDEAMMSSATAAIAMNATGACNEGFARSDALLVVVLITDEDDPGTCVNGGMSCNGSPGDPQDWYDHFVSVKGVATNVVALSLTRGSPSNACSFAQGTEKDGTRIMQFVQLFGGNGLLGDICAQSFGPFFDDAVALIQSACSEFTPQG